MRNCFIMELTISPDWANKSFTRRTIFSIKISFRFKYKKETLLLTCQFSSQPLNFYHLFSHKNVSILYVEYNESKREEIKICSRIDISLILSSENNLNFLTM